MENAQSYTRGLRAIPKCNQKLPGLRNKYTMPPVSVEGVFSTVASKLYSSCTTWINGAQRYALRRHKSSLFERVSWQYVDVRLGPYATLLHIQVAALGGKPKPRRHGAGMVLVNNSHDCRPGGWLGSYPNNVSSYVTLMQKGSFTESWRFLLDFCQILLYVHQVLSRLSEIQGKHITRE